MPYTGTEEQIIAFGLVEDQAFKDACLVEVIIQILRQRFLGERPSVEYGAILARYLQAKHIVHVFLSCLIFHHRQRIAGLTADGNEIRLTNPFHLPLVKIGLHANRLFRLHLDDARCNDIVTLFLSSTSCQHDNHTGQQEH